MMGLETSLFLYAEPQRCKKPQQVTISHGDLSPSFGPLRAISRPNGYFWNARLDQAVEGGNSLRNCPIDCYWSRGSSNCICLRRLGNLQWSPGVLVSLASAA